MCTPSERVKKLRERAVLKEKIVMNEPELLWARSWPASYGQPWYIIRRGQATADVLKGITPVIDEDELVVGKFCPRELTQEERVELENWRRYGQPATHRDLGIRSHMAVDYEKLLRLGITGIKRQIEDYRSQLELARPDDLERDAFYRACLTALEGVVELSNEYGELAGKLAATEKDDTRRRELLETARICRKVPLEPASTFHEAIQSVHFVTFCLCAGQKTLLFQLGRPDRYLLPFYRRDLAAGRLTGEAVQELIDCLSIMLNEYTLRGAAVGFMVGGRDSSGSDITNELTYMFIESISHTRLSYPGIGLCWNPDTPPDLMHRACGFLSQGLTHPAIFNDDLITAGLLRAGLPYSDACLYVQSTCVEITPIASSNVWVASPYINLVQLLHDILGVDRVSASDSKQAMEKTPGSGVAGEIQRETLPKSFDELLSRYRRHLCDIIRQGSIEQNTFRVTRRYHGGYPLLSCFVNDCLSRGRDIDHGGARYNWIEPSFVGLANLVDAIAAMRKLVFDEQSLELAELVSALRSDFSGREDLRLRLLNKAPKYGNDDDGVDDLAVLITGWIAEECSHYRSYLGGRFHPGLFCWQMHQRLGRDTAASADGRRSGFPMADGAGGAQGRERNGPTAAVRSVTKWDHSPMLGGIAVNFKFAGTGDKEELARALQSVVETFMKLGGFEAQVNVADRQTLMDAKLHPEKHRDLVVRVAGYSDYFVGLPSQIQDEIIMRTEFGVQ